MTQACADMETELDELRHRFAISRFNEQAAYDEVNRLTKRLTELHAIHERRQTELIESNNALLERARKAEAQNRILQGRIGD